MELDFSFVYLSFILAKVICGERNSCDVLKTGSCVHTIHVSITSDLKTFSVHYKSSITNKETTAVCDWTGHFFLCETKSGINYNAVSRTQVSFKPKSGVGCLDGNFTLNANGHGNFACIEKSEKKENSCAVLKAGSCTHTIHVNITSELKTFSVSYRRTSENKDITAVCDWTGHFFLCETKSGINYNAVSRTQVSFKPKSGVACLDGSFTLNANGHGNFACIEKSEKSRSESADNPNKHRWNKGDTVKDHHILPQEELISDIPKTVFDSSSVIASVMAITVLFLVITCCIWCALKKRKEKKSLILCSNKRTRGRLNSWPGPLEHFKRTKTHLKPSCVS